MRRILLENIMPGQKLGKPLYNDEGLILLNAGIELKEAFIQRLKELSITYIYVEDEATAGIDVVDVINERTRVEMIVNTRKMIESVRQGNAVNAGKAKKLVNNLVDELCQNRDVMLNFVDMRGCNDRLFSHSVSVCILSVMAGLRLGFNEIQLQELGVGALLHDVGKTALAKEVVNKTGKLSPAEAAEMKKHPALGFDILRKNPDISLASAHCAFQHHERLNGSGYPRGIQGDELHRYGKIVAIADVFDTLTAGDGSYKPVPINQAIMAIEQTINVYFDPQLVEAFMDNIAVYPIGTVVELNSGKTGIVVDISRKLRDRPLVRLLTDAYKQYMVGELVEIDLAKEKDLFIVKALS